MHPDVGNDAECYGMTLRDYFAAMALPELMSANMVLVLSSREQTEMKPSDLAIGAYEFADAMIAERDK